MLYKFQIKANGLGTKHTFAEDTTTLNDITSDPTLPGYNMDLPMYMIEGKLYPGNSDITFASFPSEDIVVNNYTVKLVKAILYNSVLIIVFEENNEVNRAYVMANKAHTFNSLLQEAVDIGFKLDTPYTLYYGNECVDGESNVFEMLKSEYELKVVVGA